MTTTTATTATTTIITSTTATTTTTTTTPATTGSGDREGNRRASCNAVAQRLPEDVDTAADETHDATR